MDFKQLNDTLGLYIRPQTFPLAIKLCRSAGELSEKVRMPARDLGYQITLCQAIGIARRFGWTMAVGKDDQCCAGGATFMGFLTEPHERFASSPEKQHEAGKYSHVLIAPTHRAAFEPDVIAMYGNSAQVMRMVQAATRMPNGSLGAAVSGGGDCGDIVARTVLSGESQFILPSGGDRVFGSTQDHEVIFAMPRDKVEAILKSLADTHEAGFIYPILTDLRHPPALPPFLKIPEDA